MLIRGYMVFIFFSGLHIHVLVSSFYKKKIYCSMFIQILILETLFIILRKYCLQRNICLHLSFPRYNNTLNNFIDKIYKFKMERKLCIVN